MTKPILGGRSLKYKTPDDLRRVIEQYLNNTDPKEYTITGLALAVGSKQLLSDYQKRKDYKAIVNEARLIVENSYEKDLRTNKSPTGSIFALKNMGWRDRVETEVTGKGIQIAVLNYNPNQQGQVESDTDTNKRLPAA